MLACTNLKKPTLNSGVVQNSPIDVIFFFFGGSFFSTLSTRQSGKRGLDARDARCVETVLGAGLSSELFAGGTRFPVAEPSVDIPARGEKRVAAVGRAEGSQHTCGHYHTDRKRMHYLFLWPREIIVNI